MSEYTDYIERRMEAYQKRQDVQDDFYGPMAAMAREDDSFRAGLLAAASICRTNDRHTSGPPCPATMAAVYIERVADGELP